MLWALLVLLGAAALIGLGIVFAGAADEVVQLLLSVLVLAGALLLALPAELHPWPAVRGAVMALAVLDAVLAWLLIWMPEVEGTTDWIARSAAVITTLLVAVAVALTVLRVVRGPRMTLARVVAWVSHATGLVLVVMVWMKILSDGEAGPPDRIIAGLAIIYAASSLGAVLIGLLRRFTVVPREMSPEGVHGEPPR